MRATFCLMVDALLQKISDRSYVVGIVGLGYVGLPLALTAIEAGFRVVGLDIDGEKMKRLQAGETYIEHIGAERVKSAVATGRLAVSNDFAQAAVPDCLILCVPTPLGRHLEPDISYITNTMASLLPHVREGQLISLESTTYPGTTQETVVAPLESQGFKVGTNVFVAYSPEREDPGNPDFETRTIPKVVGGHCKPCLRLASALYSQIVDRIHEVSTLEVAETAKLLENIYRAVNIGLVNEMKVVTDRMGIDIWEVIRAAATKPFGFTPFYPGPGLGGHCIPIDPFYLTWKAKEFGVHTRFIELAGQMNHEMPRYVVQKTMDGLNAQGKPIRGAKILVLGIAYKPDIDDARESPSCEIMEILREYGAEIAYTDPHFPEFPRMREHRFELTSVPFTATDLAQFDCAILATDHKAFDYDMLLASCPLIIDARGRYKRGTPRVVHA
ncbi:MAG: nucleotide sugar dehydrogenase [Chthonomonas sp.]|nr:nucleotide sugar dehydrogenase [Chthonomonas sp.]